MGCGDILALTGTLIRWSHAIAAALLKKVMWVLPYCIVLMALERETLPESTGTSSITETVAVKTSITAEAVGVATPAPAPPPPPKARLSSAPRSVLNVVLQTWYGGVIGSVAPSDNASRDVGFNRRRSLS